MISYFSGSVRGLGPGSEVTMHGLVVGHVTDVHLSYDAAQNKIVAPVRFEVEPERNVVHVLPVNFLSGAVDDDLRGELAVIVKPPHVLVLVILPVGVVRHL